MWILILAQWVYASPVLVKAPETDLQTYQVFLENSDNTRPSDIDIPCSERSDVEQYYHSANDNFLNGSLEKAKIDFTHIANIQWNCDWKSKDREIISESLLRLSQISTSEIEQKKWLRAAVEFDPQMSPNAQLFPPPFLKNFEATKKDLNFSVISLTKYYDTYVKLFRNGRTITVSKKTIKIPLGRARFTFVSDSHAPRTLVLNGEDLQKQTVTSAAYIDGDCKSHRFQKPSAWNQDTRLFFSPECIVDSTSAPLLTQALTAPASLNSIDQQLQTDAQPRQRTWIERNYIWVGAAIVGAVLISAEMNNRKQTQTVITPSNSVDSR